MINKELFDKYYGNTISDSDLFQQVLLKYIKSDMVILDAGAGCGEEYDARLIKSRAKQLIGVDIDESVFINQNIPKSVRQKNFIHVSSIHFFLCLQNTKRCYPITLQ